MIVLCDVDCDRTYVQKLKVPDCYPLQRIKVSCEQLMGVTEAQWRRWELQMVALLSHKVFPVTIAVSIVVCVCVCHCVTVM